jgi:ankyrin repeat protein
VRGCLNVAHIGISGEGLADVNNSVANQGSGEALVWIAAQEGHVDMVEALGRLGPDVNRDALDGRTTTVHIAAVNGHAATRRRWRRWSGSSRTASRLWR